MPSRRTSAKRAPSRASETPWFPIAVLGLFAVGCLARASGPTPKKTLRSFSFQVDGDSELYPYAKTAAEYWSNETGATITVTPDGEVPILLVDQLSPECVPHAELLGCSSIGETPSEGWIEISSHLDPALRHVSILRQMGHQLRGSTDSLSSPGSLMAPPGERSATDITPADVAFVCTGRLACPTTPA